MIRPLLCCFALAAFFPRVSGADELLPAPNVPAVDGVDLLVVTRTAKLREALATAGMPSPGQSEGLLRMAALPLPKLPDDAISSVVYASTGGGDVDYRLVSLTKALSMEEFMTAAGVPPVDGSADFRELHNKLGGLDHHTGFRRFSPQEYLITRRFGRETLSQPAKVLSSMRTQAAKLNCLILAACSSGTMRSAFAGALKPNEQVAGATFGLLNEDGLRLFGRVETGSPALAAKLKLLGAQFLPKPVPGSDGPSPVLAAAGKTAGFDFIFSGSTASGFLQSTDSLLADAGQAKASRTAQSIASVYSAGRAAGCEELDAAKSIDEVMAVIRKGTSPSKGQFRTSKFQFDPGRDRDLLTAVYGLLEMKDGDLRYRGRATAGGSRSDTGFLPPEKMTADARKLKARRNAQNACSVFSAAMAAGTTQMDKVNSVESALTVMMSGVTGSGPFSSAVFKLDISEDDARAAAGFMEWNGEQQTLTFVSPP